MFRISLISYFVNINLTKKQKIKSYGQADTN